MRDDQFSGSNSRICLALPSPHYLEFCKCQGKPSMDWHVIYRALPWSYFLPSVDGQHSQGQPCRCNVQVLQKSYDLWSLKYNITCLHWPNLQGYKLTQDKQKWYHVATHPFKMFKSFLTMPMHGTSSKYGSPSDHISQWHHAEHSLSILNTPTFHIHVNQASLTQRHHTCNHFEWVVHKQACHLEVLLNQQMH